MSQKFTDLQLFSKNFAQKAPLDAYNTIGTILTEKIMQ